MNVLVIGGGFAGYECVKQLSNQSGIQVTLVDRTNHHCFQPLLYQVATSTLASSDIASPLRAVFAKSENVSVVMDEISTIDADAKKAIGESGKEYQYDKLVMAAGARTSFFGNDQWAEHTIGLKSLADANAIRQRVLENFELAELSEDEEERKRLMTIAIVGGGPTGVELAGAFMDLMKRSMKKNFRTLTPEMLRIVLVEAAPRLLPPFHEKLSEYTKKSLEESGVEVRIKTFVTGVEKGKLIMGEETLEAGAILWGAGVQGADVVRQLPTEVHRNGKVTPEANLSLKTNPEIFLAGDVVQIEDINGVKVPGVAPAATQMGEYIAKELIAEHTDHDMSHRTGFSYLDKGSMAIIGKGQAVMQVGDNRVTGPIAWLGWLFVHVLVLAGLRSKINVLYTWHWQYLLDLSGARIFSPTAKSTK